MTVEDLALFIIPEDKEYQFPAMAAVQGWLRAYKGNTYMNDHPYIQAGQPNEYKLITMLDCSQDTYDWWMDRGLALGIGDALPPVRKMSGFTPTVVFDLSEERANHYDKGERHVTQVYSSLIGSGVQQFPALHLAKEMIKLDEPYVWNDLTDTVYEDDAVKKFQTGLIATASWQTYYAATLGYGVIEILPKTRSRVWMSKWANPLYRCIEQRHASYATIESAKRSIEQTCRMILDKQQQPTLT